MSKKVVNTCVSDALRDVISVHSERLRTFIDRGALMKAYQIRRRSERLYAYHSILRDACCGCFRGTGISGDGRKCVVWGFGGSVWSVIPAGVFRDVVGEALIGASGIGDFVVKGDWVEKQGVILASAYAGVCSRSVE